MKEYIVKDTTGKVIHSEKPNRKVFTGITHSPENPPACTAYGF